MADRFHVLSNLRQAIERLLMRHHACLRDIPPAPLEPAPIPSAQLVDVVDQDETTRPLTRAQREKEERQSRRHARYEEIMRLDETGMGIRAIGRELEITRHTVRRFIRAEGFPERAPPRPRPGILTPYEPYLRERWAEGYQNGHQLYREIREQGYAGSCSQFRHVLATCRSRQEAEGGEVSAACTATA